MGFNSGFKGLMLHVSNICAGVVTNKQNQISMPHFNTLYHSSFIVLYYDQQMHIYFTNYHTATCFDTIVSSSDSL